MFEIKENGMLRTYIFDFFFWGISPKFNAPPLAEASGRPEAENDEQMSAKMQQLLQVGMFQYVFEGGYHRVP